ncbi:MAG: hypothetical protein ABI768_03530 [Acidobacteriota bacterium]
MIKVRIARALLVASVVGAGLSASSAEAQVGLQFYAVTPCRVVDTRTGFGGIIPASTLRQFTIKGLCGVPGTAKAVSLNATIVAPTVDGFFSLWPAGGVFPVVSTLNFLAGEPALANGAIVPLAATTPDLSVAYGTALGAGQTHAVLDVTGYFQ